MKNNDRLLGKRNGAFTKSFRYPFLLLLSCALVFTCLSIQGCAKRKANGYDDPNLLFEDCFDGQQLDNTKWEFCPQWKRQGERNVWDNEMTYLDGEGHLILRAQWDDSAKLVRSGAVRTLGHFASGYGYYEASIRFPVAPGTWGAFWLMCGDVASGNGVEIDIIESIRNDFGRCSSALHWDGYGDAHKTASSGALTDHSIYDGDFHTFGLERSEDGYVFYIDGKETWRAGPEVCEPCPDDGYIKLSVEAADWAGANKRICRDNLPAEMAVDYVRVYREKPAITE